jgi:hypothetical protein
MEVNFEIWNLIEILVKEPQENELIRKFSHVLGG